MQNKNITTGTTILQDNISPPTCTFRRSLMSRRNGRITANHNNIVILEYVSTDNLT